MQFRRIVMGGEIRDLRKVAIHQMTAYLGRAIGIATRLQAAVKQASPKRPGYKALVSNAAVNTCLSDLPSTGNDARAARVACVRGDRPYACTMLRLIDPNKAAALHGHVKAQLTIKV